MYILKSIVFTACCAVKKGSSLSNPFDDENAQFYVLVNEEAQHSLWPVFAAIPSGWTIAFGPARRADSLEYVESHWTDMRPASLVEAMSESE